MAPLIFALRVLPLSLTAQHWLTPRRLRLKHIKKSATAESIEANENNENDG